MNKDASPLASDFRDAIPTADRKTGDRIWIYPRQPQGRFYRWRSWVAWILLAILAVGPFIKINGAPLLMMNIPARKFALFGQVFWPQDLYIFALLLLTIFVMIVLFTAVFGRVWCGWLCPQTIFMEMVFRKIEYGLEGDAHEQRALDAAPWTRAKWIKKGAKHAIFFGLSFLIGNWLLTYIIGIDAWWALVTDNPMRHLQGLAAMIGFSLLFYGIFARFREQACTFICPYGRFQSVLLDNDSIVVAYDHRRGEPQQRFRKDQPYEARKAAGIGDCINCRLCVEVCPTGIDIRNGTQMECVNCTACIDACDGVMDRLSFPRGLIRYASQRNISEGLRFRVTARMVIYSTILLLLSGVLVVILATRSNVETQLLRAPGALFTELPDNEIGNIYMVKIANKTMRDIPLALSIEWPDGAHIRTSEPEIRAARDGITQTAVVLAAPRMLFKHGNLPIAVGVYQDGQRIRTLKVNLIGPQTT